MISFTWLVLCIQERWRSENDPQVIARCYEKLKLSLFSPGHEKEPLSLLPSHSFPFPPWPLAGQYDICKPPLWSIPLQENQPAQQKRSDPTFKSISSARHYENPSSKVWLLNTNFLLHFCLSLSPPVSRQTDRSSQITSVPHLHRHTVPGKYH